MCLYRSHGNSRATAQKTSTTNMLLLLKGRAGWRVARMSTSNCFHTTQARLTANAASSTALGAWRRHGSIHNKLSHFCHPHTFVQQLLHGRSLVWLCNWRPSDYLPPVGKASCQNPRHTTQHVREHGYVETVPPAVHCSLGSATEPPGLSNQDVPLQAKHAGVQEQLCASRLLHVCPTRHTQS